MNRPKKSQAIQKARRERNRLTFRWFIAGGAGVLGLFLGVWVYYWIHIEMERPPYRPDDVGAEGFAVWWYEFAQRWKYVLASATSGISGVLLATLTFLERRKEVATRVWGAGVSMIVLYGVGIAWANGLPVAEIAIPAFLCSLGMNLLLGMEIPPIEEDPLIRKHLPTAIPASPSTEQDANSILCLTHNCTQKEFVDDTIAVHFLPGSLTTLRISRSLGIGFIFLLVLLLLHFFVPDFPQRTLILGAGATVWVLLDWLRYVPRLRRQMTKASTEKLELSFPITEDWELSHENLTHRMEDEEAVLSCSALENFKELQDGFHIGFGEKGAAFIPYRAFADDKERRLWRARFRAHLSKKTKS